VGADLVSDQGLRKVGGGETLRDAKEQVVILSGGIKVVVEADVDEDVGAEQNCGVGEAGLAMHAPEDCFRGAGLGVTKKLALVL
jgi:hypothetical protein